MPAARHTALDLFLALLLLPCAALWSLAPYPRDDAQLPLVLAARAFAALLIAIGFWRRWGSSDEGAAAMRMGLLGGVSLYFLGFSLATRGGLWQLPGHLGMLLAGGTSLYAAFLGVRAMLAVMFGRARS